MATTTTETPADWLIHYWPIITAIAVIVSGLVVWVWRREVKNWLFRVEDKLTHVATEAAETAAKKQTEKTLEVITERLAEKTEHLAVLVDEKTREIQPHKNGGYSLSDANSKINLVVDMIRDLKESNRENFEDIRTRVTKLESSQLDHLQAHAEQRKTEFHITGADTEAIKAIIQEELRRDTQS